MYTFTHELSKKEYDEFVENYSMASFMQEYNWANVKNNWDSFHCGLYKDNSLVGVCSILVKNLIFGIKLFYVPRGYLIDFTNYEDLKAMTNNIKILAKKNNAYAVKIDPNFCISDNSFKDAEVEHNYSYKYTIKNKNLLKLGYKSKGVQKEIYKNFQPQYNVFAPMINLENNIITPEEILKNYKSKFKYYLGSFQEKRGVSFEISNDIKKVDELIEMLHETEKKQNINLRNKEYFVKIMNEYKDTAYIVTAKIDLDKYLKFLKDNNSSDESIEEANNLIKEKGNSMLLSASLIILPYNKKGIRTSEYLYAGNSLSLTKLNISAALVFEVIKFSIEKGCHYCNLGGVDGNLNDPLTTFKRKFNGRIMEFAGEYDLPTSWLYYPIRFLYPILMKIYRKIKR